MSMASVDRAVAAAAVGADRDQVLVVAVGGQQLADRERRLAVLVAGDLGHQPAEAFQHVDGRVVPARGQAPREPGVAVQQAAHRVAIGSFGSSASTSTV